MGGGGGGGGTLQHRHPHSHTHLHANDVFSGVVVHSVHCGVVDLLREVLDTLLGHTRHHRGAGGGEVVTHSIRRGCGSGSPQQTGVAWTGVEAVDLLLVACGEFPGLAGGQLVQVGSHNEHGGVWSAGLDVEQPGTQVVDALVPLLHVPHNEVECVSGEEALVRGVVHLLASHVPDAEVHLRLVLQAVIHSTTTLNKAHPYPVRSRLLGLLNDVGGRVHNPLCHLHAHRGDILRQRRRGIAQHGQQRGLAAPLQPHGHQLHAVVGDTVAQVVAQVGQEVLGGAATADPRQQVRGNVGHMQAVQRQLPAVAQLPQRQWQHCDEGVAAGEREEGEMQQQQPAGGGGGKLTR